LGVRVFFVLSGFLITSLLIKEFNRSGRISLTAFYRRRMLRIFPALYLYVGTILAFTLLGWVNVPTTDLIQAATFTWNYGQLAFPTHGDGLTLLGHLWTLSIEEQFYLLWPATLALIGLRRGIVVPVAIIIILPLVRVVSYFAWPECRPFIAMMLHTSGDSLMFGCAAALLTGKPAFERMLARLIQTPWSAIAAAVFAFIVAPQVRAVWRGSYDLTVGMTLEYLCITVVMLYVIRQPAGAAGRVLNSRPLVAIGVLSYSIYLWNWLFLSPVNTTWTGRFPIGFFLCFVAGALSYWCIEKPFLRLKDRGKPALPTPKSAV
jgi:peptidoglycan/LPS O-acetylase OafA/YrhL